MAIQKNIVDDYYKNGNEEGLTREQFKRKMELYNLWDEMNNPDSNRIALAIANRLIRQLYGMDFYLQLEALKGKHEETARSRHGIGEKPKLGEEYLYAATLTDLITDDWPGRVGVGSPAKKDTPGAEHKTISQQNP